MSETTGCTHLDTMRDVKPHTNGCEECLKMGDTWVHLRLCTHCGHVGCCDSSQRGEHWKWCFIDALGWE
jgi:hypothetical protein